MFTVMQPGKFSMASSAGPVPKICMSCHFEECLLLSQRSQGGNPFQVMLNYKKVGQSIFSLLGLMRCLESR